MYIHSAREVRSSGSILLISITVEMVHRQILLGYLVWPINSSTSISTLLHSLRWGWTLPHRYWCVWTTVRVDTTWYSYFSCTSGSQWLCFQGLRNDGRKRCPGDSQVCRHVRQVFWLPWCEQLQQRQAQQEGIPEPLSNSNWFSFEGTTLLF